MIPDLVFFLIGLFGSAAVGICVTFVLRWLATRYKWNLPRPA